MKIKISIENNKKEPAEKTEFKMLHVQEKNAVLFDNYLNRKNSRKRKKLLADGYKEIAQEALKITHEFETLKKKMHAKIR